MVVIAIIYLAVLVMWLCKYVFGDKGKDVQPMAFDYEEHEADILNGTSQRVINSKFKNGSYYKTCG